MSATKEYYHELIQRKRRKYCVTELQNLEKDRLIEIASTMNITVAEANEKQTLIYAILNNQ
jgi:hypothetical protein